MTAMRKRAPRVSPVLCARCADNLISVRCRSLWFHAVANHLGRELLLYGAHALVNCKPSDSAWLSGSDDRWRGRAGDLRMAWQGFNACKGAVYQAWRRIDQGSPPMTRVRFSRHGRGRGNCKCWRIRHAKARGGQIYAGFCGYGKLVGRRLSITHLRRRRPGRRRSCATRCANGGLAPPYRINQRSCQSLWADL